MLSTIVLYVIKIQLLMCLIFYLPKMSHFMIDSISADGYIYLIFPLSLVGILKYV